MCSAVDWLLCTKGCRVFLLDPTLPRMGGTDTKTYTVVSPVFMDIRFHGFVKNYSYVIWFKAAVCYFIISNLTSAESISRFHDRGQPQNQWDLVFNEKWWKYSCWFIHQFINTKYFGIKINEIFNIYDSNSFIVKSESAIAVVT